ncbi:MAG: sensor histidine kinase [Verrucomicrobiota bacterium]
MRLSGTDNRVPAGWTRDGNHSSMASIVTIGPSPTQKAFAILDDDGGSHAEWHNIMEAAPKVTPGEQLLIEWNEAFSIGVGDLKSAQYANLREGTYRFRITGTDIFGNPVGPSAAVDVLVPPLFWRTTWFWGVVIAATFLMAAVAWRYIVWQRVRREMVRLKHERALENERLRIAQDLHDDFGARVTEISIASALASKKPNISETAGADFDRISNLSRELVFALYETVWAVNPENDNLDALGNYLCQMINRLCEQAQLPCRLRMGDLPQEIQVSSQTRHNIMMAVKEAVHNVIKHAQASEVILSVEFAASLLTISVQDNGRGFPSAQDRVGNGLTNMKRRLADLGGTCDIHSNDLGGTNVVLRLQFKTKR